MICVAKGYSLGPVRVMNKVTSGNLRVRILDYSGVLQIAVLQKLQKVTKRLISFCKMFHSGLKKSTALVEHYLDKVEQVVKIYGHWNER